MDFKEGNVALDRVDSDDDTYRISTDNGVDRLAESIKILGVVNPPIFIEKSSRWTIVSGFRRVRACHRLGWDTVKGRLLPPTIPAADIARLAIAENALVRQLNLVELSRVFGMLHAACSDDREAADQAASLGLAENAAYINKVKKICRMPRCIQQGILSHCISLATALELDKMAEDTAVALAHLFNELQLGLNKQRELITLIREITAREEISIFDLLENPQVQDILNGDNKDRAHKARQLRIYLRQRRYPFLTKAEETLRARIRRLKLGNGLSLKPPLNFEGPTYALEMTFRNKAELIERKTALDDLVDNQLLHRILED